MSMMTACFFFQEFNSIHRKGFLRFQTGNFVAMMRFNAAIWFVRTLTLNLTSEGNRRHPTVLNVHMKQQPRLSLYRLVAGLVCNILILLPGEVGKSNAPSSAYVLVVSFATAGFVFVVPVFWRGVPWQAPIAFVLLWLPALALYMVISVCLGGG